MCGLHVPSALTRLQDFVQDRYTVEREDTIAIIPSSLRVCEMLTEQVISAPLAFPL